MSILEIHLIVNHIPIVGTSCTATLLLIGLAFRNTFLQKIALWFLLVLTAITIVAYFSGDQAGDHLNDLSAASRQLLKMHSSMARTALLAVVFVGGCSLVCLLFARFQNFFKYCTRAIFAMTAVCVSLFILTGYLGGQLAYEEIRSPLTQSLSINTITLAVVGLMALISFVTIAVMFQHRDTLFTIPSAPLPGEQLVIPGVELPMSNRSRHL